MRRATRRQPRGYVLLVTLGLLVLASGLMVSVARTAVTRTTEAHRAAAELQRRWGAVSCRVALLGRAESILGEQEALRRKPSVSCHGAFVLGGQRFEVVLSDESAKANVNVLLETEEGELANVDAQLRRALADSSAALAVHGLRLRPGPAPTSRPALGPPVVFEGLGQLFDGVPPAELMRASALVTCWGDGLLNARRAPEPAMRLVASRALSGIEIERLVEARDARLRTQREVQRSATGNGPTGTAGQDSRPLVQLFGRAGIGAEKITDVLPLSEGSTCHSLWVVVDDGRRRWYSFTVADERAKSGPVMRSYAW